MPPTSDPSLYERDFYLWTQDQAARLRAMARDNELDIEKLAEEVEALGRSERAAVENHLVQLLAHLLEHAWSAAAEPQAHWRREIRHHHQQARRSFTPGMRQHLDIARIWADAVTLANDGLRDHGDATLPADAACPFGLDDLLSRDFDSDTADTRLRLALGRDTDGA